MLDTRDKRQNFIDKFIFISKISISIILFLAILIVIITAVIKEGPEVLLYVFGTVLAGVLLGILVVFIEDKIQGWVQRGK